VSNKPNFEDYLTECIAATGFPGQPAKAESTYTFNMRSAHQAVTDAGKPLEGIVAALNEMRHVYLPGRPDLLFYPPEVPADLSLQIKPFISTMHKIYRQNIVFNRHYPKPPPDGGIEPSRFYEDVDDLIRTRIVCKYMDGPQFACERLTEHCNHAEIRSQYRDLGTDAGYYAWHFYLQSPVVLMLNGEVQEHHIWVEIQLTQLAEVITSLTHGLYAERREGTARAKHGVWKWDAGSQRFRSAYLGHGLHLLEGVIQTFRDDVLGPAVRPVVPGAVAVEPQAQPGGPAEVDVNATR
jgi:Region found in RelA / SpoT proteins